MPSAVRCETTIWPRSFGRWLGGQRPSTRADVSSLAPCSERRPMIASRLGVRCQGPSRPVSHSGVRMPRRRLRAGYPAVLPACRESSVRPAVVPRSAIRRFEFEDAHRRQSATPQTAEVEPLPRNKDANPRCVSSLRTASKRIAPHHFKRRYCVCLFDRISQQVTKKVSLYRQHSQAIEMQICQV
jgi:hypothetical protein